MALYQAQSIWVPLKASRFPDDKSPSPSQFTRPSSSKSGTRPRARTPAPLVCAQAAPPIINVATAGTKDVRVPSTPTFKSDGFSASVATSASPGWEQELADGMIDLGGLELSRERRAEVVEAVRAGAERGFFYITNFGVESELLDQLRAAAANFFALPAEEKAKVVSTTRCWEAGLSNRGQGHGSRFSAHGEHMPSFRETFRWTSQPEALQSVLHWPPLAHAQVFRDTFFKYQERAAQTMHFISGLLAEGLGLPASYIADQYEDAVVSALFTHTPPHTPASGGSGSGEKPVPGLTPHTDSNFFNINVAGCGGATSRGLQFFEAGEWHNMPTFRHAALVDIGEDWETVSNGKYHSGVHRVLRNSETSPRMAFLTTVEAQAHMVLAPAAELIHPDTSPAKYRPRRRADRIAKLMTAFNGHSVTNRTKMDMMFNPDLHLDKARDIIMVGDQEFLGGMLLGDM